MEQAVIGMRADSDAAALTRAHSASAVPAGAPLLGFSPEAVATTIRRARRTAPPRSPTTSGVSCAARALAPMQQMATDQVLTEEVGAGRRGPTLRIWEWASPAVVIGSFQCVKNEVDLDNAHAYGFEVVRRISGGGAMFIEPQSAITYSLYAPVELVQGMSFAESYAFLDELGVEALQELGIDASYVPLNDIASPAGKIGGAAQKRLGTGAVLHHTTMAYDMDGDRMIAGAAHRPREDQRQGHREREQARRPAASRRRDCRATRSSTRSSSTFRALNGLTESAITAEEMARVEQLVAEKFGTHGWVHRVP